MFRAQREQLVGQSFEILYPTADGSSAPAGASRPNWMLPAATPTTG
jgi:hypothetical protein